MGVMHKQMGMLPAMHTMTMIFVTPPAYNALENKDPRRICTHPSPGINPTSVIHHVILLIRSQNKRRGAPACAVSLVHELLLT